jgi:hypothetical protein
LWCQLDLQHLHRHVLRLLPLLLLSPLLLPLLLLR